MMNSNAKISAVSTFLMFAALALPAGNATAQDTKSLAGTYTAISNPPYGDNPRGQLILGRDGRYSIILARTTLPKIAGGARDKATTEETKEIVQGSNAHYGKYTVDGKDKTITFYI
jgi:Lipocalin-like domain